MPAASTVAAFSVKTIGKTQFEMQKVAFLRKRRFRASYLDKSFRQKFSTVELLKNFYLSLKVD
jgi:hypothetical protein